MGRRGIGPLSSGSANLGAAMSRGPAAQKQSIRCDQFLGMRSASREGSEGPVGAPQAREELMAAISTVPNHYKSPRKPIKRRSSACLAGGSAAAAPSTWAQLRRQSLLSPPCPALHAD